MRAATQRSWLERAERVFPAGSIGGTRVSDDDSIVVSHGRGSHIWDVEGREYVDFELGSGPLFLGHAFPPVVDAVTDAVAGGSTFHQLHERAIRLAEEVIDAVPRADLLRFTTSGADATLYCIRLARAYTHRELIVKFDGAYHGAHDYGMVGYNAAPATTFPVGNLGSAGIPKETTGTVLIAPFNDLNYVERLLSQRPNGIAAVIVEPIQRTIPPSPGFLAGLRELTTKHDAVLIFDEVVTGFRLGYRGAQAEYGVEADLTACGKVLGGGYPLAALVGPSEIMRHLDPRHVSPADRVFQSGTLNANPVSTAAGLATLETLRSADYAALKQRGRRLMEGLREFLAEAEVDAQVVGHETLFEVFFTSRPVTNFSTAISDRALRDGFSRSLAADGIHKGGGKFYVGFCHTDNDVNQTLEAFRLAAQRIGAINREPDQS